MKRLLTFLLLAELLALTGCSSLPQPKTAKTSYSSFDLPSDHPDGKVLPAGTVNLQHADASQVLAIYADLAKRTVVRGPLPNASINLRSTIPMNRVEMLQLFDTVLAENGITMILMGDNAVKAVPASQAPSECPPEINLPWQELPDSSSYVTRTVRLKNLKAAEMIPVLRPMSKLPDSIIAAEDQNALILRDYASNIRAELRLIEELEKAKAR